MAHRGSLPPQLQLDGHYLRPKDEHRRHSSEFGWYDVEALLTAKASPAEFMAWGRDEVLPESTEPDPDSSLPPALERVFAWLETVEARQPTRRGMEETIIDEHALSNMEAPSSSIRQDGDKVNVSRAVTKNDFSLASRERPSLAIGVYAHRVLRRSGRFSLWPDQYAEFLVVLGTETDLLMAWRCHSDFCSLAEKARRNGAHRTSRSWDQIHHKIGRSGKMDPARLKLEARYMSHFLTAVLQELGGTYSEVIENFVRVPTTYTVTSVEHAGRDTNFDACANETKSPGPKETKVSSETSRPSPLEWSTPSVVGGVLEADTMFPFEHQGREQLLKPVSRAWDGL